MDGGAMFEDEDQFVPAPVERPHATVIFDPDADIFQLVIRFAPRRQQFTDVSPIHTNEMDRTIAAIAGEELECATQKSGEFERFHFAAGHNEIAMANRTKAAGAAFDSYVVG